jgi:hypothetical protein
VANNSPQQQFAAKNAELLRSGYTISPITGQVFRVTAPKERDQNFIDLEKDYSSKRSDLIAYCRQKGYNFDPVSKQTTLNDGTKVDVNQDPEFLRVRKACDYAKTAIKSYKQKHPAQFMPNERKRRRNVDALRRAAERRLARLASRQVTAPLMVPTVPITVPVANLAASAASSAVMTNSMPNPTASRTPSEQKDFLAIVLKLSQAVDNLIGKVAEIDTQMEEKVVRIVMEMTKPSEHEEEPQSSQMATSENES